MRWLIALLASMTPVLAAPGTYLEVCSPGSCRALDGSTQPAGTVINRVVVDPATFSKPGVAYVPDDRRPLYSPPLTPAPLPGMVNVRDFGAVGDGVSDDTAAFNAAAASFRATLAGLPNGSAYTMVVPPGNYVITSSVNWTGFDRNGAMILGHGATLIGKTNGKAVVDMMGSRWVRLKGLHIWGTQAAPPSIGIQIGRSTVQACSNGNWSDVIADGWYGFTAIYIMGCETTGWYSIQARNNSATANVHALVLDGVNHWNVGSDFVTLVARDTPMGFNEATFVNAMLATNATDAASSPLWISRSQHLKFINSYAAGSSPYQVIVWVTAGQKIDFADLELHTENLVGLQSEFYLTGTEPDIVLDNWRYSTQVDHSPVSLYATDPAVVSVTMRGAVPIETPSMAGSAVVFGEPSKWTVSGRYVLPAGTAWNLGCDRFQGFGTVGGAAAFCGNGAGLSGIVASVPSDLQATSISNGGSVTGIVMPAQTIKYNIEGWCFHSGTPCQPQYAHQLPTVTIAPPPAGGSQARAVVSSMALSGATLDAYFGVTQLKPENGGAGYAVNDAFTIVGGTCSVQPRGKVVAVAAGVVTGWLVTAGGACSVMPLEPVSVTGGTGSGLTLAGLTWLTTGFSVTDPGSGYASPPAVTAQPSPFNATAWPPFTAAVASALAINAATVTVNGALVPQGGVSCSAVSTSTMRVTNGIVTTC